jgi:hypothetical protein
LYSREYTKTSGQSTCTTYKHKLHPSTAKHCVVCTNTLQQQQSPCTKVGATPAEAAA